MPRRKPKAPLVSAVISPEIGVDNLRTSARHIQLPGAYGASRLRRHYGSPQSASLFHAAARIPSDLDEKTYFELHGVASPCTELRDRPGSDSPVEGPGRPPSIIDLTVSQADFSQVTIPRQEPTSEPGSPSLEPTRTCLDELKRCLEPDIYVGHQRIVPDSCPASPILSHQIPDSEPGYDL